MVFGVLKHKRIKQANLLYWLLLVYTIAALVWWFISLEKQNKEQSIFEIQALKASGMDTAKPALYASMYKDILLLEKRRSTKHISEGLTFLIVILAGAIFVYRAVGKQLRLNKQQQNFIMAVTHELKTPIAISKLNVETLRKHSLPAVQEEKLLNNTLHELHRLNDLATNILVVAQIESGDYKMNKEDIDISALTEVLVNEVQAQNPDRVVNKSIESGIFKKGDTLLLKLAFQTLLDNALKYSPRTAPVSLLLNNQKMVVEDAGCGIAREDKERIFDKFYRVGNESTRTTKGTGLGLYLCRKILTDHHCTISVNDNVPNGSIFTIQF